MRLTPVFERELRVSARNPRMYRARLASGTVAFFLLAWMTWLARFHLVRGGQIFMVLSGFGFAVCLLGGLARTADCVSAEKRDGTFGLLFLTDLGGREIILGKLLS